MKSHTAIAYITFSAIVLPIWFYLVYNLVQQADIAGGIALFWLYVIFKTLGTIVSIIAQVMDE